MAELGLIAAVVQVADVGIRLSVKIYTFGQVVASADESIVFISRDISHTCSILKSLGQSLEKDREAHLYSHNAITTADTIVKECLEIFHEMDGALLKKITRIGLDGTSGRVAVVALERLKWPFSRPKIMTLWSNLGKLKSSLHLMLNLFIYTRLVVERTVPPSVITDQRMMYEGLLHTVAEQSRKIETLKASMARNGHTRDLEKPSDAATQQLCILDATTGVPGPSIKGTCTRRMRIREVNPATTTVEHYCALIECLMQEIEANDHDIGHEMRCRMKDDIIRIHKREARMLRAAHGHRELRDLMHGRTWRLAEMDDERGAGDPPVIAHGGSDSLPAVFQNWNYDLQPGVASQDLGPHEGVSEDPLLDVIASRGQKAGSHSASRERVFILAIEHFLEDREDPWHPGKRAYECSEGNNPNALEEISWLPFQRSGTSIVATDRSYGLVTITSFEDRPPCPVSLLVI